MREIKKKRMRESNFKIKLKEEEKEKQTSASSLYIFFLSNYIFISLSRQLNHKLFHRTLLIIFPLPNIYFSLARVFITELGGEQTLIINLNKQRKKHLWPPPWR